MLNIRDVPSDNELFEAYKEDILFELEGKKEEIIYEEKRKFLYEKLLKPLEVAGDLGKYGAVYLGMEGEYRIVVGETKTETAEMAGSDKEAMEGAEVLFFEIGEYTEKEKKEEK